MLVNNVTVCLDISSCTRNCPYCISKMTPKINTIKRELEYEDVKLGISWGIHHGASSLLITSRGEPTINPDKIMRVLRLSNDIPSELQTNGDFSIELLDEFKNGGLRVLAVSVDSRQQVKSQEDLYRKANDLGIVVRWTVCLHDVTMIWSIDDWIHEANKYKVQQLSFRRLRWPRGKETSDPAIWIRNNTHREKDWLKDSERVMKSFPVIRSLDFGIKILDAAGVSLTYFPDCVQEESGEDSVRSLIIREDGHAYTSWSSLASILF